MKIQKSLVTPIHLAKNYFPSSWKGRVVTILAIIAGIKLIHSLWSRYSKTIDTNNPKNREIVLNLPPSEASHYSKGQSLTQEEFYQSQSLFALLPDEVILKIFAHVGQPSLTSRVCKTFYRISNDENLVKNYLLENTYDLLLKNPKKETLRQKAYQKLKQELKALKLDSKILIEDKLFSYRRAEHFIVAQNFLNFLKILKFKGIEKEIISPDNLLTKATEFRRLFNEELNAPNSSLLQITVVKDQTIILTRLPEEIGKLLALQTLYLSDNHLTEIPASIGNLSALHMLYLYNNHLKEIPASIGNLSALRGLAVSSNHLTEIPAFIGNLSALKQLYLYNNHLTEIPASIGNLSALQMLYLYNNHLKEIPASIGNLLALHVLDLYNNQLTEIPDSIYKLPLQPLRI